MKDSKSWAIILLVVGLVIVVWTLRPRSDSPSLTYSPSPTTSVTAKPITSAKPTGSTPTSGGTLKYQEALNLYGDRKIQFDATCRGTPATLVVKTGTKVLFDNRAAHSITLNINGPNYTLPAYSFQVITLSSSQLPKNIGIDCKSSAGSSVNSTTVIIEK